MIPDTVRRETLVLGVVGHRPPKLDCLDDARLRDRVREVLQGVGRLGRDVALISPVAEGADRLVAHQALDLGWPLTCFLPFDRDLYRQDFTTRESRDDYQDLLRRSQAVRALPGVHGTEQERDAAYAALSDALLDEIELLIAVWDGNEARGIGGTADTVHDALTRAMPVIWIGADPPHNACLLRLDSDGAMMSEPLDLLPERLPAV